MPLTKVKEKLEEAIGLNMDSIGITALESAVMRRMYVIELETYPDYVTHLFSSKDEIKYLIEEIVVPETWFFRDKNPFIAVGKYARKIITSSNFQQPLRILTLPSATGEEPYSVAITLFECGFSSAQFSIDAMDVSKKALQAAEIGIYGKNSFRGEQDNNLLDKYFVDSGGNHRISDQIQKQVHFSQVNILKLDPGSYSYKYDIIFCRNLLIYFDGSNKQKAFKIIDSILKEKGLLLLGHAESSVVSNSGYAISEYEKSFSFIKDSNANQKKPSLKNNAGTTIVKIIKNKSKQKSVNRLNKNGDSSNISFVQTKKTENNVPEKTPESEDTSLNDAKQLADIGELNKAKNICMDYLKKNKGNSQSYFLLGLIAVASEELDLAEEHLRKSIYLDPKHYEALIHLSFLLEKSGDIDGADRLRKRATRNQPG